MEENESSLTAIAAVARNRVIGDRGEIPWHIPADLRRFKEVTMGGVLIMGRVSFESLGKPLKGRIIFVVSRTRCADHGDDSMSVCWVTSVDEALDRAFATGRQVFVAGGEQIYRSMWDQLTDLDITEVDLAPEGDAFFPEIGEEWVEVSREPHDGWAFVHYSHA